MKVDDAVETITRFFNDIIGSLIPGMVLGSGLAIMHAGSPSKIVEYFGKDAGLSVAVLLTLSFATGHCLMSIYTVAVEPFLKSMGIMKKDVLASLAKKPSYEVFRDLVLDLLKKKHTANTNSAFPAEWGYHDLRNLAMSISSEGASLGRRFMFISLLCSGVGTALLIMLLDFLCSSQFAPQLLFPFSVALPATIRALMLIVAAFFFFRRGEMFFGLAMATPFPIALTELSLMPAESNDAT